MATDDEVYALYQLEKGAFYTFVSATRGEGRRAISPKKVRETEQAWELALAALRTAGGTPDRVGFIIRDQLGKRATGRRK